MTTIVHGNHAGTDDLPQVRRVLIVTDMVYQGLSLQRLLTEMGDEVTVAVGEESALIYLSLMHYDMVVLDVDMGYQVIDELAMRLRRDHPQTQVVGMVGWWDNRAVDMRAYSNILIYKPAHPQQLREALGRRVG